MNRTLRILAVDDEPLALRRVELLLAQMPGVQLIGTASSGEAAVALIRDAKPDLLLLDIEMADVDGFDVVAAMGTHAPLVVFVTAFDRYAVRAFDADVIDYVLKPVRFERLQAAVERARRHRADGAAVARAADPPVIPLAAGRGGAIFRAERRGEYVQVAADAIDWIEAERDYVHLHAGGRSAILRSTLSAIHERLGADAFMRIRRSALVRLSRISAIRRAGYGDYRVQLAGGEELRVGRTYLSKIRAMIARR